MVCVAVHCIENEKKKRKRKRKCSRTEKGIENNNAYIHPAIIILPSLFLFVLYAFSAYEECHIYVVQNELPLSSLSLVRSVNSIQINETNYYSIRSLFIFFHFSFSCCYSHLVSLLMRTLKTIE